MTITKNSLYLSLLAVISIIIGSSFVESTNKNEAAATVYDHCWTTVGATGIVDQDSKDVIHLGQRIGQLVAPIGGGQPDLTKIKTFGGAAYLLNSKEGIYHIRYPINQQFLFSENSRPGRTPTWNIALTSRYKVANQETERVVIHLNRYSLYKPKSKESVETMLTFDSDLFAASNSFQVNTVRKRKLSFDFQNYGYFIDAQLITKKNVFTPTLLVDNVGTAIGLIQLCSYVEID